MAAQFSVFSSDGALLRRIGRRGRGPGELATPTGFAWGDDGHLWVSDPENLKYAVFDGGGHLVETIRRPSFSYPKRQYPLVHVEGLGLIDQAMVGEAVALLRVPMDGSGVDTLMSIPLEPVSAAARDLLLRVRTPETEALVRHYLRRKLWAIDPAGAVWTATNDAFRFVKQSLNGDTLMVVSSDHPGTGWKARETRTVTEALRQGGVDRGDIRPVRPELQSLNVLDDGHLLAQLVDVPGLPSSRFDVYGPGGLYLGVFDLGFAPHPLGAFGSRGDTVVAPTLMGALEVPAVVGTVIERERRGP